MPEAMSSRERVLAALARQEPDRVPYCEFGIDRALAQRLMGWGEAESQAANLEENPYTVEEAKAIAQELGLDNLYYVLRAPVYAEKIPGKDGRFFYGRGYIQSERDVERIELPDPTRDALYAGAEAFVRGRGDYALVLVTRFGVFPTMLSMGMETFSLALYENRSFVEAVLGLYVHWAQAVMERACALGFDAIITTDDMAFNTAPFFSPKVFREVFLPHYRRVAQRISVPWLIHSDGNVLPLLDDLLSVGIAGLHPIEKGAMDIRALKKAYGDRLCLLGNVDLNLLGMGTPEEVEAEVYGLIRDVAPGGCYILTSGNSLAGYLLPENVRAMVSAVKRYGRYPITL